MLKISNLDIEPQPYNRYSTVRAWLRYVGRGERRLIAVQIWRLKSHVQEGAPITRI